MNKKTVEILRNIEILCFLNKTTIKKQKDLILTNISKEKKLKAFIKYLKNLYLKWILQYIIMKIF